MQPRLKSGLWVRALIRRYDGMAVPAIVVRKGDETLPRSLKRATSSSGGIGST